MSDELWEPEMEVIMPTIERYEIKTPEHKIIHTLKNDELHLAREMIDGTRNYIHYIFKTVEIE